MVYTSQNGIYHGISNIDCSYTVFFLPFPGGHFAPARKVVLPTVSEDGETQESQELQDDISDWGARDWEDYNYVPPAGGAGGGKGAGGGDPLANLCDGLPGLEAADIAELLRDLPMPTQGDVPEMTVEEAIEVRFCIYLDI